MKSFYIASFIVSFVFITVYLLQEVSSAGYDPAVARLQDQVQQLTTKMNQVIDMLNMVINMPSCSYVKSDLIMEEILLNYLKQKESS